jgi:hypothetical protein
VTSQTAGAKAVYVDGDTLRRYSGAGVILFEVYNGEPVVILFRNSERGVYEDLGGGLDYDDLIKENPLKAAGIREAFEESRGLINIIDPKHMKHYVDGQFGPRYYRTYLIGINQKTLFNDYHLNKKIIDKHKKIKPTMKETDDIDRFYIKDLVKDGIMDSITGLSFMAVNVNGEPKQIYTRTVDMLKLAISDDLVSKIVKNPVEFVELVSYVG